MFVLQRSFQPIYSLDSILSSPSFYKFIRFFFRVFLQKSSRPTRLLNHAQFSKLNYRAIMSDQQVNQTILLMVMSGCCADQQQPKPSYCQNHQRKGCNCTPRITTFTHSYVEKPAFVWGSKRPHPSESQRDNCFLSRWPRNSSQHAPSCTMIKCVIRTTLLWTPILCSMVPLVFNFEQLFDISLILYSLSFNHV